MCDKHTKLATVSQYTCAANGHKARRSHSLWKLTGYVSKEVKFTLILPKWCINLRANQQIEVLDIGEKDIRKIKHSNATEHSWGNMVFLIKYIWVLQTDSWRKSRGKEKASISWEEICTLT